LTLSSSTMARTKTTSGRGGCGSGAGRGNGAGRGKGTIKPVSILNNSAGEIDDKANGNKEVHGRRTRSSGPLTQEPTGVFAPRRSKIAIESPSSSSDSEENSTPTSPLKLPGQHDHAADPQDDDVRIENAHGSTRYIQAMLGGGNYNLTADETYHSAMVAGIKTETEMRISIHNEKQQQFESTPTSPPASRAIASIHTPRISKNLSKLLLSHNNRYSEFHNSLLCDKRSIWMNLRHSWLLILPILQSSLFQMDPTRERSAHLQTNSGKCTAKKTWI
jgi:hypothetical protein